MTRVVATAGRVGVALALSLTLLGSLAPTVAQAVTPSQWGWVTVRKPSTASYTPAAKDQGNSTGGTNTVVRQSTGIYLVTFGGLNPNSLCPPTGRDGCDGTAQVTALSPVFRMCNVGDMSSGPNVAVYVTCTNAAGAPADSRFSVNFLATFDEHGTLAYVYADNSGTGVFTPNDDYNYNSALASSNTEERLSTGYYRVHLYGMYAQTGGNLQLTSTGYPCKLENFQDQASPVPGVDVYVQCADYAGDPVDGTFFLAYTNGVGLTGIPGHTAAYLLANKPTTGSYHPLATFRYSSVARNATVRRAGTGVYSVTLSGMPFGGSSQVTAIAPDRIQCQLGSIRGRGTPQVIGVRCFDAGGNPADSLYYLTFTR